MTPSVDIRAPIDVVWAVMTDTASYPHWNPFVVRVDRTGLLEPGGRMTVHLRWADGSSTTVEQQVLVVDPPVGNPRRATLSIAQRGPLERFGLVQNTRHQWLEERPDGGTTWRTEGEVRGLFATFVRLEPVEQGYGRQARALAARATATANRETPRVAAPRGPT